MKPRGLRAGAGTLVTEQAGAQVFVFKIELTLYHANHARDFPHLRLHLYEAISV